LQQLVTLCLPFVKLLDEASIIFQTRLAHLLALALLPPAILWTLKGCSDGQEYAD
jgi:hypothetical protein